MWQARDLCAEPVSLNRPEAYAHRPRKLTPEVVGVAATGFVVRNYSIPFPAKAT